MASGGYRGVIAYRPLTVKTVIDVNVFLSRPPPEGMAPDGSRAEESREAIMRATYRALCANGYADLTIRHIADEIGKSRTLIHYHYDTKEELLESYLDRMIGWVRNRLAESETEHPVDRLAEFIDFFVIDPAEEGESLGLAILEMRLQAIHNDTYRRKLTAHYEQNVAAVADIITAGIAADVFQPVDPEAVGEAIYSAMEGARTYQLTLDGSDATARMGRQIWRTARAVLFTEAGRARLDEPAFPSDEFRTLLRDMDGGS